MGDKGYLVSQAIFTDNYPYSDDCAQQGTVSGKYTFQYDPLQGRCVDIFTNEPAQSAQE